MGKSLALQEFERRMCEEIGVRAENPYTPPASDPLAAILAIGPSWPLVLALWDHLDTIPAERWIEEATKWGDPMSMDKPGTVAYRWSNRTLLRDAAYDAAYPRHTRIRDVLRWVGESSLGTVSKATEIKAAGVQWNVRGVCDFATIETAIYHTYTPTTAKDLLFVHLVPDFIIPNQEGATT